MLHISEHPEFNLNWSVQHHELFCEDGGRGLVCTVYLLCLFGFFLSFRSDSFTLHVATILASQASLRDRGCPSHCGVFSLEEAQLCCSVSTRGSACNRLWVTWADGNLKGNIKHNSLIPEGIQSVADTKVYTEKSLWLSGLVPRVCRGFSL